MTCFRDGDSAKYARANKAYTKWAEEIDFKIEQRYGKQMIRNNPMHDTVDPPGQARRLERANKQIDGMCQDEDNRLSKALSTTPNAREHARDAAAQIKLDRIRGRLQEVRDGPTAWAACQEIDKILDKI